MNLRNPIPAVAAGTILALLSCTATDRRAEGEPPALRPNLLVVVTDDQRADALGCAGNPIILTPNMDALAGHGLRFTHAFVTTPICAASRASILTGLYERAHGYTFGQPPLGEELVQLSYPRLLRQAGYRTGFVGKLGVKIDDGGTEEMFDVFRPAGYPYFAENLGGRHLTDVNTDQAIEFLRECDPSLPFCLSISYSAPHAEDNNPDQYVWPAACDALYEDVVIPAPATSDPAFFEALPEPLRASLNRERWHWRFDTPEKHQRMVKGYYRMISGVDMALGRLVVTLEELGLDENTIVVLVGDNGYFLGERGYAGKWSMHDLSTRVPLIVHDPRAPAGKRGRTIDELVLNVDLAPTLLDLAGIPVPRDLQGRSLRPFLEDLAVEWREEVFTEHLWEYEPIPRTEAVRTKRWKYVRYLDHPELEELYDLARDPREEFNLAGDEAHEDQLRALRKRCTLWVERVSPRGT